MSGTSRRVLSIRNILTLVFLFLTLTTVGVAGTIVFSHWLYSANTLSIRFTEDLGGNVFQKIDSFLNLPVKINEENQELIQNNVVDLNNAVERDKFFVSILKNQSKEIYSIGYGTAAGAYYGARDNQNQLEIMREDAQTGGKSLYYSVTDEMTAGPLAVDAGSFDPRTRDWYQAAEQAHGPTFSPVYKHFVLNDLALSAVYPVYGPDGGLKGVLATHLVLEDIDRLLNETVGEKNGYAAIFEKDSGYLIGNSFGMQNFSINADGSLSRFTLKNSPNAMLKAAYVRYLSRKSTGFKIGGSDGLYVSFREYQQNGLQWIVMTAVPVNLLMAGIYENMRISLLLVAAAAILSIAVCLVVMRRLFKPIDSLTDATERWSNGDLSERVAVIRNDEIGRISAAFNRMADTIRTFVQNLEATVSARTDELKAANAALEKSKDQLRLILDSTAESIYGIDTNGICTFCNESCAEILGFQSKDELVGKNIHELIHHSHKDGTHMPLSECRIYQAFMQKKGTHADNEVFWKTDGTSIDVEYYSYPQFKDGQAVGAVVTFLENSEKKQQSERMKYLSCHDALTGLLNRRCFDETLREIDADARNLPVSVIFGDVNSLKQTNDIFGHAAGDILIQKMAETLKKACRSYDILARVGGDEFIILLPNTGRADAEKLMKRIRDGLSQQSVASIRCSMSLGCDTKTDAGQEITQVIAGAESRMYHEKTMNRKATNRDMIRTIQAALHEKYPEEKESSRAVGVLCEALAAKLGLKAEEPKLAAQAGALFNIGKAVSDSKTTGGQEPAEANPYAVTGYRILNLLGAPETVAEGVYSHTEHWDGSGSPRGLKGEEIPVIGRVIAVASACHSMTARAPGDADAARAALGRIRDGAGSFFDPEVVRALLEIAGN